MARPVCFGLSLAAAALIAVSASGAPLKLDVVSLDRLPEPKTAAKPAQRPVMLPDGVIAEGTGTIRAAWLTEPTRRYSHGVLGDEIEAGGVAVEMAGGAVLSLTLVFCL